MIISMKSFQIGNVREFQSVSAENSQQSHCGWMEQTRQLGISDALQKQGPKQPRRSAASGEPLTAQCPLVYAFAFEAKPSWAVFGKTPFPLPS